FRVQPLKFLQDDHLRRIEYRESFGRRTVNSVYVGAGFGALYSLQWDKQRAVDPGTGNFVAGHEGRDHGFSYVVSTDIGFEIPLHSLQPILLDSYVWSLVVTGQANFAL